MATRTAPPARRQRLPRPGKRWLALVPVVGLGVLAWAVLAHAGVALRRDPAALARLDVQTFGGSLASVHATTSSGKAVPLDVSGGRLTPMIRLTPGERISVDAVVRRPGSIAWALGKTRREHLVVTTPTVSVASHWLTVARGAPVTVALDGAAAGVVSGASGARRTLRPAAKTVVVAAGAGRPLAGTTSVAVAARTWERLQPATKVTWFPKTAAPAATVLPADGAKLSPLGTIRMTFAGKVADVLGGARPAITPKAAGKFSEPDEHTLVFTPSGSGFGIGGGTVHVALPKALAVVAGSTTRTTRQLTYTVPAPSTLRLEQLLAQGGYLPLSWAPADGAADVARTRAAQAAAAVDAPAGTFSWTYNNTPSELKRLWSAGQPNTILRGAVMQFQDTHHLTVDGFAGPAVWQALLADTIAGKRRTAGYSYVFVHRDTPQLLTLWHNGHVVLTSPGNTGVPAAPTKLGTFPVFEHLRVTTMSGTNPDGTHYHDPNIKWVSYFNGGDALHTFNRASFGTPQSLGCVELPEAAAKRVWPYTPIGTLVTIEH